MLGINGFRPVITPNSQYCSNNLDQKVNEKGLALLQTDSIANIESYLMSTWTPEQDFYVISIVWQGNLDSIDEKEVKLRSISQCKLRFRAIMQMDPYLWILLTQQGWKLSQDLALHSLAIRHENNWQMIASVLPRTAKECKERWCFLMTLQHKKPNLGNILKGGNEQAVLCGYDDLANIQRLPPQNPISNVPITINYQRTYEQPPLPPSNPIFIAASEQPQLPPPNPISNAEITDFHLSELFDLSTDCLSLPPRENQAENNDFNVDTFLTNEETQVGTEDNGLNVDNLNAPDSSPVENKESEFSGTWSDREVEILKKLVSESKEGKIDWYLISVQLFQAMDCEGVLRSQRACSAKYAYIKRGMPKEQITAPTSDSFSLAWSPEEANILMQIIHDWKEEKLDWYRISVQLFKAMGCKGTLRSPHSCRSKYFYMRENVVPKEEPPVERKNLWQAHEDEALLNSLEKNLKISQTPTWRLISDELQKSKIERTDKACKNRLALLIKSDHHHHLFKKFPSLSKNKSAYFRRK